MAILALVAVIAHVIVVVTMATDTFRWRIDIDFVDVATRAGNLRVRARQRIATLDLMVVKRVGPLRFSVAVLAVFAEIAHVRVVFEMTRHASRGDGMERLVGRMTVLALRFDVTIAQHEVRESVVEFLWNETDYVRIPASMLGMTARTILTCNIRREAVKPGARLQVLRNFRMAGDAQVTLLGARKPCVTVRAFRLEFGMTRDYGTGHHDAFERF
jgi:hypothetical protein